MKTAQPRSQGLSSSLPLERERRGEGKRGSPGSKVGKRLWIWSKHYQRAVSLMTSLACSIRIWSTLVLLNLCYKHCLYVIKTPAIAVDPWLISLRSVSGYPQGLNDRRGSGNENNQQPTLQNATRFWWQNCENISFSSKVFLGAASPLQ